MASLDIVRGRSSNDAAAKALITEVEGAGLGEGTLYVGYPVVASESDVLLVDALLVTSKYGLQVFDLTTPGRDGLLPKEGEDERIRRQHLRLLVAIKSKLIKSPELCDDDGDLAFKVNVYLYDPGASADRLGNVKVLRQGKLQQTLAALAPKFNPALAPALTACVQNIARLRGKRQVGSKPKPGTRKETLERLQAEVANLDHWQKKAAIESPDGPQRIRGIAGSGKTVVLALKAAYLHSIYPDWTIGFTFFTRSLYQQLRHLVRQFHYEMTESEPDWERLRILHSWGGRDAGVYSLAASAHGVEPRDYGYAKETYGSARSFEGVCTELLPVVEKNPRGLFDLLLIDEAQDLPASFLRLCHAILREPKRLVWAYDDLQSLSDFEMLPLEQLFGKGPDGKPRVSLEIQNGWASQDVILPVCYRNTPWALVTAHAFGFGVYRNPGGLVQFFDTPELWRDIGYEAKEGKLKPGTHVVLQRRNECVPEFLPQLVKPDDGVVLKSFDTTDAEANWVASSIKENIEKDALDARDILIVFPDPRTIAKTAAPVVRALDALGIQSHIAGVLTSRDELFSDGSVAISGIFRAKGNEAPMVYVMNADYCAGDYDLKRRRNSLFTAITRSRAWVRISGVRPGMTGLEAEFAEVKKRNFTLAFEVPTKEQLERIRRIHRDMSPEEHRKVAETRTSFASMLADLEAGRVFLEDLPADLVEGFKLRLLKDLGKKK